MLGQACFHDYLNLVKILFLQMEEGEFANKEYAVQVSKIGVLLTIAVQVSKIGVLLTITGK